MFIREYGLSAWLQYLEQVAQSIAEPLGAQLIANCNNGCICKQACMGGDLRGTVPQNLRWGRGCVRKYELSKKGVLKEFCCERGHRCVISHFTHSKDRENLTNMVDDYKRSSEMFGLEMENGI